MVGNPLRDLLNRLRWDGRQDISSVVVSVRVRREGGQRVEELSFASVAEVGARGVTLQDGTFVPFHRVAAVFAGRRRLWPREVDG